jgi:transcriptional regulator with GAF, ATPase, and Fis domain
MADRDRDRIPGIVVVFTGGAPAARAIQLATGSIELGRGEGGVGHLDDVRVSRHHARVDIDREHCIVTDLASQNGTFLDGKRITPMLPCPVRRIIRVGDTLLMRCSDVRPLERDGVRVLDGFVRGPAMQAVIGETRRLAGVATTLHVRGETGTGKEAVAHAFHRASPRAEKPPVIVNCATIADSLAERLLFGAKRGAFSGADADATGYVQDADGSTLFLDEIAELDLAVQAKLLRVLESKEVQPLGTSKPRRVDFALCSATHRDLRELVAANRLREDLYFRIATPTVVVPPLRDRPEEIPALIALELGKCPPPRSAHVSLVEQCLLRPWPGNVRELLKEIRAAAAAVGPGESRVSAQHLAATAGNVFSRDLDRAARSARGHGDDQQAPDEPRVWSARAEPEWRERILDALRLHGGNRSAAARALGLHRTQLIRLLKRHGLD